MSSLMNFVRNLFSDSFLGLIVKSCLFHPPPNSKWFNFCDRLKLVTARAEWPKIDQKGSFPFVKSHFEKKTHG